MSGVRRYDLDMATWHEVQTAVPELAAKAQALFDAGRHKTIATLRADGSPRISGIECEFVDGELTFGSMAGARKSADLHRDPRFALHGPTFHPVEGDEASWPGEAKITGRAVFAGVLGADDPAYEGPPGESWTADIQEVVVTGLNAAGTELVVQWWTPETGIRSAQRS